VEVGAAHPARRHPNTNLAGARIGDVALDEREGTVLDEGGVLHDPGLHFFIEFSTDLGVPSARRGDR